MSDPKAETSQKIEALKKACSSHIDYLKRAGQGHGCDRHLFGLKNISIDSGKPLHPLFEDVGFQKSFHFNTTSSQLSSDAFYVGFGPVVEDGYGVCYSLRRNEIIATISARSTSPTDLAKFWSFLHHSLVEMQDLFSSSKL